MPFRSKAFISYRHSPASRLHAVRLEPPPGGMGVAQAQSILAYMRKIRAGASPPTPTTQNHLASLVLGRYCAGCHMIEGEGGSNGPDLTRVGQQRDVMWLREWISDPEAVDPFPNMPAFGNTLTEEQLTAIVNHLAARK